MKLNEQPLSSAAGEVRESEGRPIWPALSLLEGSQGEIDSVVIIPIYLPLCELRVPQPSCYNARANSRNLPARGDPARLSSATTHWRAGMNEAAGFANRCGARPLILAGVYDEAGRHPNRARGLLTGHAGFKRHGSGMMPVRRISRQNHSRSAGSEDFTGSIQAVYR